LRRGVDATAEARGDLVGDGDPQRRMASVRNAEEKRKPNSKAGEQKNDIVNVVVRPKGEPSTSRAIDEVEGIKQEIQEQMRKMDGCNSGRANGYAQGGELKGSHPVEPTGRLGTAETGSKRRGRK